jgi:hypothetical protein
MKISLWGECAIAAHLLAPPKSTLTFLTGDHWGGGTTLVVLSWPQSLHNELLVPSRPFLLLLFLPSPHSPFSYLIGVCGGLGRKDIIQMKGRTWENQQNNKLKWKVNFSNIIYSNGQMDTKISRISF